MSVFAGIPAFDRAGEDRAGLVSARLHEAGAILLGEHWVVLRPRDEGGDYASVGSRCQLPRPGADERQQVAMKGARVAAARGRRFPLGDCELAGHPALRTDPEQDGGAPIEFMETDLAEEIAARRKRSSTSGGHPVPRDPGSPAAARRFRTPPPVRGSGPRVITREPRGQAVRPVSPEPALTR
jgi:hypothetical protein